MNNDSQPEQRRQAEWKWPARPTIYRGIHMRSRLEASWAQAFDHRQATDEGFTWAYEPLCFASPSGQYLPDFQIGTDDDEEANLYVEIKPTVSRLLGAAQRRMEIIRATHPEAILALLCGDPKSFRWFMSYHGRCAWLEMDWRSRVDSAEDAIRVL